MNINEVAKNWKEASKKSEPKWDQYESTQVTVAMAKRMYEEVQSKSDSTVYGVTHLG
jgi:hypothetical protein